MDPFSIGMALFSIGSTFASMGAAKDSYDLQTYNSDINMINTLAGYDQAILQSEEGEKAALSNISTLDFQMGQYTKKQEQYKKDLGVQQTQILSSQKAMQAATGIGGAGSANANEKDVVVKIKEYTDIIDQRLLITNEFDEKGTRIVNSEMDQLLLDQDTQKRQAELFAQSVIDAEAAKAELLILQEKENRTPSEVIADDLAEMYEEDKEVYDAFGDAIDDMTGGNLDKILDVGEDIADAYDWFIGLF